MDERERRGLEIFWAALESNDFSSNIDRSVDIKSWSDFWRAHKAARSR